MSLEILQLLLLLVGILQALTVLVGYLVWHEFKRLQVKVDDLSTHKIGCHEVFASKYSVQKLWEKQDSHDKRFSNIEGRVARLEGAQ